MNITYWSKATDFKLPTLKNKSIQKKFEILCRYGRVDEVKKIFNSDDKVNINSTDDLGDSMLMCAVGIDSYEMSKLLIENKANLNIRNEFGNTALHYAFPSLKITELLLKAGAIVDVQNDDGNTALILASRGKYWDVMLLLIKYGADENLENKQGNSALHYKIKHYDTPKSTQCIDIRGYLAEQTTSEISPVNGVEPLDYIPSNSFFLHDNSVNNTSDNNNIFENTNTKNNNFLSNDWKMSQYIKYGYKHVQHESYNETSQFEGIYAIATCSNNNKYTSLITNKNVLVTNDKCIDNLPDPKTQDSNNNLFENSTNSEINEYLNDNYLNKLNDAYDID